MKEEKEKQEVIDEKDEKGSNLDKLMNEMSGIGEKKKFKSVNIERIGDKIILPKGMSYAEGREWLSKQEQSEEQVVSFTSKIKAYPFDGAYALYRAIESMFGFANVTGVRGPSGGTPPQMIDIKLPEGNSIRVPWGRMEFPGLDDGSYVETSYSTSSMEFVIKARIKKKYENIMSNIADKTAELLRNESLYKGRAIKINLDFMDTDEFPTDPQFIDVSKIRDEDIVLTKTAQKDYSSVLLRIKRTRECITNNIPLKHGCLLAGPYGTGKTLTARWTAKIACDHGWTFIYLEDCTQLKHALLLADMYAPAVVFAEDIDKAMEGERSSSMNEILNTLDGLDTKTKPIITILTTNHVEKINKAFLRAGRIDSLIHMGPLDEESAEIFIKRFTTDANGNPIYVKKDNYKKASKALSGIVPAFASEVINKAKMYAMYREGENAMVNAEDLETAALSLKNHIKLTEGVTQPSDEEIVGTQVYKIFEKMGITPDSISSMSKKIETIEHSI